MSTRRGRVRKCYATFVAERVLSDPEVAASLDIETWRRPSSPVEERVNDLLSRMSLREKVAQLRSLWLGTDTSGQVAPHQHDFGSSTFDWEELIKDGLGQLTRPYGTVPVEPEAGAQRLALVQRRVIDAGGFGIPAMVHEECLTGLTAWKATIYPSPLSWGASFDPELVQQAGAQIGRTLRRLGVHQGLAPVLDVVRDLRWGRVEETIGEDPFLVGTIGSAYVRGLESEGIVATLKHFVGYSSSRAGRNFAPVSVGRRELADVLLPPFEMALRDGARSVMNSYTDIDGVPVAADKTLLTGLLRDSWGFTGTVVSDYYAIGFLESLHHVAPNLGGAAALALEAGVDVELPNVNAYGDVLVNLVESGEVERACCGARSQASADAEVRAWAPRPRLVARTSCPSTRNGTSRWRSGARNGQEVGRALDSPAVQRRLPAFEPGPPRQRGGPSGFGSARDARLLFVPHARRRASPRAPGRSRRTSISRRNDRRPRWLQDLLRTGLSRGWWATRRGSNGPPRGEAGRSRLRYLRCSPR